MQIMEIWVHAQEHRNIGDYSSYEAKVSLGAQIEPDDDPATCLQRLQEQARAAAVADCDTFLKVRAENERIERDLEWLKLTCDELAGGEHRSNYRADDEDERDIATAWLKISQLPELHKHYWTLELEKAIAANGPVRERERQEHLTSRINRLSDTYKRLREGSVDPAYQDGRARAEIAVLPEEMRAQHLAILEEAITVCRTVQAEQRRQAEEEEERRKEERRRKREGKKKAAEEEARLRDPDSFTADL